MWGRGEQPNINFDFLFPEYIKQFFKTEFEIPVIIEIRGHADRSNRKKINAEVFYYITLEINLVD